MEQLGGVFIFEERSKTMKLIYIRHGEEKHTKGLPMNLQLENLSLTKEGRKQALLLQSSFP